MFVSKLTFKRQQSQPPLFLIKYNTLKSNKIKNGNNKLNNQWTEPQLKEHIHTHTIPISQHFHKIDICSSSVLCCTEQQRISAQMCQQNKLTQMLVLSQIIVGNIILLLYLLTCICPPPSFTTHCTEIHQTRVCYVYIHCADSQLYYGTIY